MSHKPSFGPLCPQSAPGGQKGSGSQLPAWPCPARGPRLQKPAGGAGEMASLPARGSLGGKVTSSGASPVRRNRGRTQLVEQGYFFLYHPDSGLGWVYTLG